MSDAWTAADDALLRDMRAAGKPAREIAAALGRTKTAVQVREHRLRRGVGPSQQVVSAADRATMVRLFESGLSCRKIGAATGWSWLTVVRVLARLGVRPRGRPVAKPKPPKRPKRVARTRPTPPPIEAPPPVITWEMALAGRRFQDRRPKLIPAFPVYSGQEHYNNQRGVQQRVVELRP